MKIRKHKESGLWIREDGAVLMPAHRNNIKPMLRKFRWTYGFKDNKGYLRVFFRGKHYQVHRLVAQTFLGDPPFSGATVDHINRDKTANFVLNLRWADYKLQADNHSNVINRKDYGVRECNDTIAYHRSYQRTRRAEDPDFAEHIRAKNRKWQEKQKELGRRYRRCPDGKHHWLTDAEYNERYSKEA